MFKFDFKSDDYSDDDGANDSRKNQDVNSGEAEESAQGAHRAFTFDELVSRADSET